MTAKKTEIAIIGAAGFTGRELLEILSNHPSLLPVHITSDRHEGKSVGEIFPNLEGRLHLTFKKHEDALPSGIPVFLAVPNDTSLALVPELLAKGHKVVDLSGAYRLHNIEIFEKYYNLKHTSFDLMKEAVFGMPELFREKIKNARLIGNPGCYPTAAILPLYFLKDFMQDAMAVSIDAKSGVSGAGGRTEDAGFSFNSVYENFRAYKIVKHQHEPEIREYSLPENLQSEIPLVFTPHLLPVFRGILSTTVIHWKKQTPSGLKEALLAAAAREPFIRVPGEPEDVQIARVQKTNFVDMGIRSTDRSTVIVSAIDNLVKGAAGQAVQNMNLLCGIDERSGLLSL